MSGGVINGQSVDQVITNAAFLFKNANDSSTGVYTLLAPTSGPQVNDIQNTINVIINGLGGSQSAPATAYSGVPSNTIANGDTHVTALQKLADKFFGAASAGGHTHAGTDGDGATVIAVKSLSASGGNHLTGDVTLSQGLFISLNESGNNIQVNVVCPGLPDVLASNNSATAGINFNGGAIAGLSYEDRLTTAFPPGYPASGHVYVAASGDNHFYLKTSASATQRIDASIAPYGGTAIYGDVILAPSGGLVITQSGQTITLTAPSSGGGGGGSAMAVLSKAASYTVNSLDFTGARLLLEYTGATAANFTLPAASTISGYELNVINVGTAVLNVITNGTDTFGSTSDTTWTLIPGGSPQASNTFLSNGGSRWDGF